MTQITFKGHTIHTVGALPPLDETAPLFTLTQSDLSEISSVEFKGKTVILNIFPSLDTKTCSSSVKKFNEMAKDEGVVVLCISADLPFAHQRFCETNHIHEVQTLSSFRNPDFGHDYGVTIQDGPLKGLLSRAVIVISPQGQVAYTQQVPEIVDEPDYQAVLDALKNI